MAFHWKTFQTRAITAIIFAVVVLGGILLNHWTFFILFSVIHFGCWIEYQRLVNKIDPAYQSITPFHRYGVMLAGWGIMLHFCSDYYALGKFQLNSVGLWLGAGMFLLMIIGDVFSKQNKPKVFAHSILGLIYISFSLGLMMDLSIPVLEPGVLYFAMPQYSPEIPLLIIFSIWINDTMAYIVGSLIGKTPLSSISPKKTWEGTIGGMALSTTVIFLLARYAFPEYEDVALHFAIIAFIASVTGTLGDLFESKLKRLAGVKDSGHIMPGHGGFLDRFDSLLVAIPFVWLYVKLFFK